MAHYAELDDNNVVLRVCVVADTDEQVDGVFSEERGVNFCKYLWGGNWVKTSYNGNIRKNYAGIGFTYDAGRDAFIPPQPFESWVLVEETCQWAAPTAMPDDGKMYAWDEATTSWIEVA